MCKWDKEISGSKLFTAIITALQDKERCGAPLTYTAEQRCSVMALALQKPEDFGVPLSNWSYSELVNECHRQSICPGISKATVGRILCEADIRPHKVRYWLNSAEKGLAEYDQRVEKICQTYQNSLDESAPVVISVDEKTGIQALEDLYPSKAIVPGSAEKREFEYIRHGTLCLIPSFNVATGRIDCFTIAEKRDEEVFKEHIQKTIKLHENKPIVFVCDQLNTHKSAKLVELIHSYEKDDVILGKKRKPEGVLHNMKSRMAYLEDESHRIRFQYTPKHCSWLNQVEIWFGILSRKLLKRSSFTSKADLREKLARFIEYFNENLAKPFKWTYTGKALVGA